MKFRLVENISSSYMYHATYKPYLKEIKKSGFIQGGKHKNWSDSENDKVYLADDFDIAASYAESAEIDDEDLYDEIVVIKIDMSKLDNSRLSIDQNVIVDEDEEPHTFVYKGKIPISAIISVEEY